MTNLYVISLATDYTDAVDNFKKSCSKNNLNCKIIGLNQEFKGWKWRMKMYLEAIKYYNDDDIIIFSDCYDVIVQEDKEIISEKDSQKLDLETIKAIEINQNIEIEDELSNKNISKISLFFAPTAFKIPISLYLSKTDVIIVFAVFIVETKTEINAIKITNPSIVKISNG